MSLSSSGDTYVKLPNLFEYDDFDECRKGNPKFQYCVVQAVIHPTSDSQIWRNISVSYDMKLFRIMRSAYKVIDYKRHSMPAYRYYRLIIVTSHTITWSEAYASENA